MTDQKKSPSAKLVYASPVIQEFGNIRVLTQNIGSRGALDNGGGAAAGPKTR